MKRYRLLLAAFGSLIITYIVGQRVSDSDTKPKAAIAEKSAKDSPSDLSKNEWKQALIETKNALGNKNLPMLAAGVAYFSTLALFPLLAAAVAIAAFVITPSDVQNIADTIRGYLPNEAGALISAQLRKLSEQNASNLIVAIVAILFSLFSASSAIQNMINATNRTYEVNDERSFVKLKLISLGLTFAAIIAGLIIIPIIVVNESFLRSIGMPEHFISLFPYLRWVFALAIVMISLIVFYRYAPYRAHPKWQWVSWGAGVATLIWLIGTVLFFLYVQNFGSFGESYGVFAGIIILMMWLNLSAFIFLLGAEINHQLEKKSGVATTTE